MNMIPILSAVTGEGMIHLMLWALVIIVCLVIVWWLGKTLLTIFEAGPKAIQIWTVLFYIIGALALINFLLSLVGKPIIPLK